MNKTGKNLQEQEREIKKEKNSPETNDLLEKLLSGEDITETLETKRGTFVMKYPLPRVFRQVQILLSQRFPNVDLGNLPEKSWRFYEMYATLDLVIVQAPQWWDDLNSSEDCPDDALVLDLYRRYLRFYGEVQDKIAGVDRKSGEGAEAGPGEHKEAPVGDGAFQGVTHGVPVQESGG